MLFSNIACFQAFTLHSSSFFSSSAVITSLSHRKRRLTLISIESEMANAPLVKLNVGDKIKDTFVVKKKLGEGACGSVYYVQGLKNPKIFAAMKVEAIQKVRDDEILKMEVCVLKKLQKSKHVCRLLMTGRTSTYNFMVMSLLGKELGDLRRRMPERKMSLSTVLRIGVQCLEAIQELHQNGYVHRDIKPSNFSCGVARKDIIYLFDFGLARQIMLADKNGNLKLREPRSKVSFRGTVRYCSVNVHLYREQGRHDDLMSMLFMLIELLVRNLPWKGMARKDSGHLKETITDKQLFQGCPNSFQEIYGSLKKSTYHDTPNYDGFRDLFRREMKEHKIKMNDPYDWMKLKIPTNVEDKNRVKKADEKAEVERQEDTDTLRDVEESKDTDVSEDDNTETKGFAKEDTLENVADM